MAEWLGGKQAQSLWDGGEGGLKQAQGLWGPRGVRNRAWGASGGRAGLGKPGAGKPGSILGLPGSALPQDSLCFA